MNEIKFGSSIRVALNEGARLQGKDDVRVVERLRAAREHALAHRRVEPALEAAPALAWVRSAATSVVGGFGGLSGFSLRALLPAVLLVAGLVSIYGWQQDQRAADVEELDALLLTDDLPIDAFLDRGFEAWLKKVSTGS